MDRCTAEQGGGWGDLTLTGVAKERADPAREEAMAGGSTKVEGGEHEARDSDWEEEREDGRLGEAAGYLYSWRRRRIECIDGGAHVAASCPARADLADGPFCFRPEVLVG